MPKKPTFVWSEAEATAESKPQTLGKGQTDGKPEGFGDAAEAVGGAGEILQGLGELFETPLLGLILLPWFVWTKLSKRRLKQPRL